ncbi:hypothetical protein CCR75_001868 [Bremia lactucae]|uniref:Uncharacterized protein n=1 Tax=Bremia lactucae TaxID=4779 RepID=A0A976FPR4_BRELC|nr:hypothetical protein CCR75_001868 [Bremia lactucae]
MIGTLKKVVKYIDISCTRSSCATLLREESVVRRRSSDFFKLRKNLIRLVSWGHCGFCEHYEQQIVGNLFRVDDCCTLVAQPSHMPLCIMARSFENCFQACENIDKCIMKSFLQMEQTNVIS